MKEQESKLRKDKTIREAMLNGKKVPFDACSSRDKKGAIASYPEMQYIGSGFTYYLNGQETISPTEHHFFIYKPKAKKP